MLEMAVFGPQDTYFGDRHQDKDSVSEFRDAAFNEGSIHADHGPHVKTQLTANLQRVLMFLASLLNPDLDAVSPYVPPVTV